MKEQITTAQLNKKLASEHYKNSLYIALSLGVASIGFIVIYLIAQNELLGDPAPQLLFMGIALFFLTLGEVLIRYISRRGNGIAASFLTTFFLAIFGIFLVSLWDGVALIMGIIMILLLIRDIMLGMPRRYMLMSLLALAAGLAGIWYFDQNPIPFAIGQMRTNSPAAIASMAFLGATVILLTTTILISSNRRFKHLRTQLLLSSIIIVTIPTILATVLSAVGGYANNEKLALGTLETLANLKIEQMEHLVGEYQGDASSLMSDGGFRFNVLTALENENIETTADNRSRFANRVRAHLEAILAIDERAYNEIMVLDNKGSVVVSTSIQNEGTDYQNEPFYRMGALGDYIGIADESVYGDSNMFVAFPIYDDTNTAVRGVLVFRTASSSIKEIVENTPGFESAETYLVDNNFHPITQTRIPVDEVRTQASSEVISNRISKGDGTYESYNGEIVLGDYQSFEPLNAVLIAEMPRTVAINNSLGALSTSALLALFAIVLAIATVAVTATFTVEPITSLAGTSQSFAAGNFTARTEIDRADEIGMLGKTYNQMADQLQDVIGKLEQSVVERTRELENQTLRLRVAAEIAKDAASARDLTELLERAGALIQDRFGFYHTGIFLLDADNEYAVLAASPTDAGKQMIANRHQLRVGEVGIVGRVAATGESRISLDTGLDAVHFNNPFLPDTRSEMALPLKAENRIIGVLDVQSEQPQAFNDEDVAIMQILADQLATAIERTRLFQQTEQNLKELEQAYGQTTREGWKSLAESGLISNSGYRFDNIRIQPIQEPPTAGNEAMQTGRIVRSNGSGNGSSQETVAIPIKIRGQTVGSVTVKLKENYSSATVTTVVQAIERLSGSLESARLFEEARQRAEHEQAISQVTSAISSAVDFDEILRVAVEQIGRSLGDSQISIQVIDDTEQARTSRTS